MVAGRCAGGVLCASVWSAAARPPLGQRRHGRRAPHRGSRRPPPNTTYLIDPTLHREFQALRLRASEPAIFTIDGRRVRDEWPLEPGRHVVAAVDERGRRDSVTITVR